MTIEQMIERARGHVMTPEERQLQRRSWVVGEMMIEHPDWTRAETEAEYDYVMGRP